MIGISDWKIFEHGGGGDHDEHDRHHLGEATIVLRDGGETVSERRGTCRSMAAEGEVRQGGDGVPNALGSWTGMRLGHHS